MRWAVDGLRWGVGIPILSHSGFRSQLSGEGIGQGAGELRLLRRCRSREEGDREKGQAEADRRAGNCDGSQG